MTCNRKPRLYAKRLTIFPILLGVFEAHMKIAILFWFYKEPDICANRLEILRRYNPDAKIFGLFGGAPEQAALFQARLEPHLDDFFVFDLARDSHWKWYHGDRMIAHWYAVRGSRLDWDTIFLAQWDMLVFDRLDRQFPDLRKGQMLLSGLRPVAEVEPWWWYIRPDSPERAEYEKFLSVVRRHHDYTGEPLCCEFIVVCLPREFLARYIDIPEPEVGFLEYKIPIYAQIFGTSFCTEHVHQPWWGDDPSTRDAGLLQRGLNSETCDVPLRVIEAHRAWPWGRRIFHPVFSEYPSSGWARLKRVGVELRDDELKRRWWRLHERLTGQR